MSNCPLSRWLAADSGRTQAQVADFIGSHQPDVSDYIAGRHHFRSEKYLKLSELTGIPLAKLIGWPDAALAPRRRSPARRPAKKGGAQ